MAEWEYKSPERLLLDEINLWTGSSPDADTRARFAVVTPGGVTNLLLRNIKSEIVRDGSGDWVVTYTDPYAPERTWTARSDSITGGVLTLLARMCGLDGEIRGHLPEPDDAAPRVG